MTYIVLKGNGKPIFIISLAGAAMDRRVIISFAWVSIEVALVIFVTVLALDRPVVISCLARCVLLLHHPRWGTLYYCCITLAWALCTIVASPSLGHCVLLLHHPCWGTVLLLHHPRWGTVIVASVEYC